MGWLIAIAVLMLISFNVCSRPITISQQDGEPDKCNRASCWDEKSGRYIGADEWDKKRRMMQDSDKPVRR